ncbi:MATE family efflux transporter [Sulfitobacter sp. M23905]
MLNSSIWGLGIKVFGAAVAFLSNVLIANYLGATNSGYYYYLLSFLGLATAFSVFGGQSFILKAVPVLYSRGEQESASQLIVGVAVRTVIFSLIFLSLLVLGVEVFHAQLPVILVQNAALPYLAAALPFVAANVILSHALQVQGRLVLAFFTSGLSHSLLFVLGIAISRPETSQSLSIIYLYTSVAVFSHLLFLTWGSLRRGSIIKGIKAISVRPSSQFFIVQMALELIVQLPVILLGVLGASPTAVAGYAIVSRISLMLGFIYSIVNRIVMPQFAQLHADRDWIEIARVFRRSILIMAAVSLPAAAVFMLFPSRILSLFGAEFAQYSNAFLILLLFQVINVLTGPAGNFLMMTDRQRLFRNLVLVGSALVLSFGLIFIPRFDAAGAAVAVLLGYGFVNVSSFALSLRIIAIGKGSLHGASD